MRLVENARAIVRPRGRAERSVRVSFDGSVRGCRRLESAWTRAWVDRSKLEIYIVPSRSTGWSLAFASASEVPLDRRSDLLAGARAQLLVLAERLTACKPIEWQMLDD